jgi:hypothetical protein
VLSEESVMSLMGSKTEVAPHDMMLPQTRLQRVAGVGEYMALPKAYLTSAKNLPAILCAIQTAKAPPQFNRQVLESLEFKSPSDRKIIGVLKALKFISDDGAPTERYYAFLDQTQAPDILADGIRDAYADLFQVNINAQNLTKNELINKFQTLSQGQLSDSVMNKMTMTFTELCKLADFQTSPPKNEESKKDDEGVPDGKIKEKQAENLGWKEIRVDGLAYRVQIVSPESNDQAERRRAPGWTLLVVLLIAIFVVAGLVSIFGTLFYE